MQSTTPRNAARERSAFRRMMERIRVRLRRLFGKRDDPNIYPFF